MLKILKQIYNWYIWFTTNLTWCKNVCNSKTWTHICFYILKQICLQWCMHLPDNSLVPHFPSWSYISTSVFGHGFCKVLPSSPKWRQIGLFYLIYRAASFSAMTLISQPAVLGTTFWKVLFIKIPHSISELVYYSTFVKFQFLFIS